MNIFLYAKVKQLNKELQEVSSKVDLTKEELSQIRSRINRMKGEL
jgi:peptidoglycan hydrolase CwlO-like protein